MSSSKRNEVSFQGRLELEEVKQVLRDLVASLEEGRLVIRRGAEHVVLEPAPVIDLELTGKRKKEKQSLEIELAWKVGQAAAPVAGLTISSTEPAAPELSVGARASDGEEGDDAGDEQDSDESES